MELNVLGLRPRTFNCQLENSKSQKGYTFNLVKFPFNFTFLSSFLSSLLFWVLFWVNLLFWVLFWASLLFWVLFWALLLFWVLFWVLFWDLLGDLLGRGLEKHPADRGYWANYYPFWWQIESKIILNAILCFKKTQWI